MPNTGTIKKCCDKAYCKTFDVKFKLNPLVKPRKTEERRTEPTYSRCTDLELTMRQRRKEKDFRMFSCRQHGFDADINEKIQRLMTVDIQILKRNKLVPFKTLGKPTCGFNFSRETDNRKKNFGIMPSNLVKWRSEKIEKIVS